MVTNILLIKNLLEIKGIAVFIICFYSFMYSTTGAQNFFPSELGNKYQIYYIYGVWDYTGGYIIDNWQQSTISTDTIINGNRFVKFSQGGQYDNSKYYYFDQAAGLLFIKYSNSDSIRLAIDFNTASGDSFLSYFGSAYYPEYYIAEGDSIINFFGQLVLTTSFSNEHTGYEFRLTFAENIGIIDEYQEWYTPQPYHYSYKKYRVRSAIIDGDTFGNVTLQINSITPLDPRPYNHFPFILTGNYSSNLCVPGYDPGSDLIHVFYLDVVHVRGSDTLGTFRYYFDNNSHTNVTLLPQEGDKLLIRGYISDATIFNNTDIFPDTGYAVINVLPPEIGPKFFPLKGGNSYQYLYIWRPFPSAVPDTSFIRLDIAEGDTIAGNQFYRFVITGYEHLVTFNPGQQFRFDYLYQKLMVKIPEYPQIQLLAVDYNIPFNGQYNSFITGTMKLFRSEGTVPKIVLGELCSYHSIEWHDWSGMDQSYNFGFASDIGMSYWSHTSLPIGMGDYYLVAAVIDSVIYNDLGPFRVDSLLPSVNVKINQFPLPVDVYYEIAYPKLLDSFYLGVDHFRNGELLQSLKLNIPHISTTHDIVTLDLPDRNIGDILKMKVIVSDSSILHRRSAYPDTGYVELMIIDSVSTAEHLSTEINHSLAQNYPNPFNPSTTISYSIPAQGKVRLTVFDALGREVRELVDEEKAAGKYEINFNADGLASGMYFYILSAGERVISKKMILMK
jgi:hypothetical protein